jgi:DNA-binding GntR family transcriptional regulator
MAELEPAKAGLPPALFMDMDRSGPVPLYYQVASRIEAAIRDGRLAPGARLDNEVALAERLGISRPTIRHAIQELVDKGLLVRRRGIGTQVVQGQVSRAVELTSLYEDLASSSRTPTTRVLLREVVPAEPRVADLLSVRAGAPVLHLRRLRNSDGVPVSVLENYLPEPFTDIAHDDLEEFGLYQILRGRGVTMRVARQRIGARIATAEERRLLELESRGAVLTMDRTAFDNTGRAIEYGHHCYRPDLYSFEVTLVGK